MMMRSLQLHTILPLAMLTSTFFVTQGANGLLQAPTEINLRAGVIHAPPFAIIDEDIGGNLKFSGFEPELLKRLQIFAKEDNVTLTVELDRSPPQYGNALDLVANDCNTTENPQELNDCQIFDLIVGDYYCNPERSIRVDFTPSWLRTTMSTIKYIDKKKGGADYTTLTQAAQAGATVCVPDGTYLMTVVMAKFPKANYLKCDMGVDCLDLLKSEQCVLYVNDELLLRAEQAEDPTLEVTREQFNTQYLVWPMSYNLPPVVSLLFKKWMYAAVSNATLDELYFEYFQKQLCPVGTAGQDCELPCDPDHGTSDARGVCVCESSKFTGVDCSIEVEEETNNIPTGLKFTAYAMFGVNVTVIGLCALWLCWQRNSAQVRVSQPSFLLLVLVGCLISTSTIIAMAQEDEGYGDVPACMAIPWLYSVGFSITFGTLFAKIRRVYLIFMNAAQSKGGVESRKNNVTFQETLSVIAGVLLIDLFILVTWTVVDPLEWQRTVIAEDQFGAPLESEGHCTSDSWVGFASAIAALHLLLLGVACWMCYVARDIPTKFSEGKYLSIAMISNLQIFMVGVPILIILGTDPQASFFVRSVIIWMNDLAVVTLIFGNLMYSVHIEVGDGTEKVKEAMGQAMDRCAGSRSNDDALSSAFHSRASVNKSTHVSHSHQVHDDEKKAGLASSKHSRKSTRKSTSSKHSRRSSSKVRYNSEYDSFVDENDDASASPEDDAEESYVLAAEEKEEDDKSADKSGSGNHKTVETRKSVLAPANLPKDRPSHMSYAEDRISNLRGKHAQKVAARHSTKK